MRSRRLLEATLVALGMSACATPLHEQETQLALASICCASPQQFSWVDVAVGQTVALDVGPDSPVYDFGTGKSHFAAVRLGGSGPRMLLIKSRYNGQTTEQYFHPVVIFYGEDQSVISRVETRVWQTTDSPLGPLYMRAEVAVPVTARFASMSMSAEARARSKTPPPAPLQWTIVQQPLHTPSPTGRMDLTLESGK